MKMSKSVKEKTTGKTGTMTSTIEMVKPAGTGAELRGAHQVADGVMFVAFYPQAGKVEIAGDFNDWQPSKTPMRKIGDGTWQARLHLPKGIVYHYRLVVDGRWQQDPYNTETEANPYGELNSVIKVN